MFTKQHYIRTAKIIHETTKGATRAAISLAFADYFAEDNPKFDRARWALAVDSGMVKERPNARPRTL